MHLHADGIACGGGAGEPPHAHPHQAHLDGSTAPPLTGYAACAACTGCTDIKTLARMDRGPEALAEQFLDGIRGLWTAEELERFTERLSQGLPAWPQNARQPGGRAGWRNGAEPQDTPASAAAGKDAPG